MKKIILIYCLVFMTCYSYAASNMPQEYVIDTDAGLDDLLAIAYMFHQPNIHIAGIIIDCNGVSSCPNGINTITQLLVSLHHPNTQIAYGRKTGLGYGHPIPKPFQLMLSPISNKHGNPKHFQQLTDANSLLTNILHTAKQPINLLAIGSLTNIADYFRHHLNATHKIQHIYFMGGAFLVPGNIKDLDPYSLNKTAEWNVYFDPLAVKILLKLHAPLTFIPLDATNQAHINNQIYSTLKRFHHASTQRIAYAIMRKHQKLMLDPKWYFWDLMAAEVALDPSLCQFKLEPIMITLKSGTAVGETRFNYRGDKTQICLFISKKQFNAELTAHFLLHRL